jgi:hypothetical protein
MVSPSAAPVNGPFLGLCTHPSRRTLRKSDELRPYRDKAGIHGWHRDCGA